MVNTIVILLVPQNIYISLKLTFSDKLIIKNLNFLPKTEKNIKLSKLICYSLCQDFILSGKFATYILYSCAKFHKKSKPVTLSF